MTPKRMEELRALVRGEGAAVTAGMVALDEALSALSTVTAELSP